MMRDRLRAGGDAVRERWSDLERDWQSVLLGAAIVSLTVAFRVPIPW